MVARPRNQTFSFYQIDRSRIGHINCRRRFCVRPVSGKGVGCQFGLIARKSQFDGAYGAHQSMWLC
jgi:hypothetical protein